MNFKEYLENTIYEKEEYSINHELVDNKIIIFAKDSSGNKIARAAFIIKNDNLKTAPGNIVWVDKNYRRKGIATEMYKYAEKLTGKKIIRTHTTGEGGAFWDQPNRP
jgi:predicted GNAT family acetyltransferase